MSDFGNITAKHRDTSGKEAARALRRAGRIPAVIYGGGADNVLLSVDPAAFRKATDPTRGWNSLYSLVVEGDGKGDTTEFVMVADIALDVIRRDIIHIDFMRVNPDKEIVRKVPVVFTGKSAGVVKGGKLRTFRRTVSVAAKPAELPVELDVDVTEVDAGQSLRVKDMTVKNARLVENPEQRLCTVDEPKAKVEEAEPGKDEKPAAASKKK